MGLLTNEIAIGGASVAKTYDHYRTEGNKATYTAPDHSDVAKRTMTVSSLSPKRSGTSFGNRRSVLNAITSVVVTDTEGVSVAKDMKVEISCSLPVGLSLDDFYKNLTRALQVFTSEANAEDLFFSGKIEV